MMMAASGIPMGYEYPVPEVPFIEGAQVSTTPAPDCVPGDLQVDALESSKHLRFSFLLQDNPYYASLLEMGVPLCPTEYDDYDPNDIPPDQAAPEELPVYTEAPADDYDDYDPSDIPIDQARPEEVTEGYNYPVPENPLVLPTKPPATTAENLPTYTEDPVLEYDYTEAPEVEQYDDYDPNDIPVDQAKPEEVTEGYNYPVPENPLELPTKPSLPDCVPAGEEELGDNPYFLEQGVPTCPEELPTYTEAPPVVEEYDEYDPDDIPADQAAPEEVTEGYNYPVPENPLVLPTKPPTTTTTLPLPDCVTLDDPMLETYQELDVPLCPEEEPVVDYDEYDPNDIPADQARPAEVTEGYNYPVPENPLVLPTKPPLPECVPSGEEELGDNPYFLDQGVPICPEEIDYDEYDPSDIPEDQAKPDDLPTYTEAPVEEYDDYDPNDIPVDQAKPEEVTEGYNYPVPENPLVLPTKPPLPDCVPAGEEELGDNPYFLDQGVPVCPEDLPAYTEAPVVEEYDEYDPNDIPEDQAAPEEVTEGYNYPVPENPLVLPTRPPKAPVPDCVLEDDEGAAEFIAQVWLSHLLPCP